MMFGGMATLAAIWLILAGSALFGSQSPQTTFTADFEEAPLAHAGDEFPLRLRFSEPTALDPTVSLSNFFEVTSGVATSARRVDGRSDLWELTIAPDARSSVRVRLSAHQRCGRSGSICTQHMLPLSDRPEVVVPGPPVSAEFLGAPEYHSGLDRIAVQLTLSEPISISSRMLAEHSLEVSAGSIERVRRIDSRRDLWEVTLIPESSDELVLSLHRPETCVADHLECHELRRISDPPTLSIPPGIIYLTFDDGPSPVNTPIILDILKQHGARATFFVVGRSVVTFPEVIERIVAEGHTLANHTWSHDSLPTLTEEEFNRTLLRTQSALGEHATPCFRPPNYHYNDETVRRAAALGLRMVLNTGDTADWQRPGADVIAAKIVASARPGVILVLHDGGGDRGQTIEGLRSALDQLRHKRFAYEPVCLPIASATEQE